MTISYIYTGEPMVGTVNDDFFIGYKGSTGTDNNTINANNGDDLVIADSSDTRIPNASYLNGAIATAFNFETLTSTWTTAENQMFGDFTIPHLDRDRRGDDRPERIFPGRDRRWPADHDRPRFRVEHGNRP